MHVDIRAKVNILCFHQSLNLENRFLICNVIMIAINNCNHSKLLVKKQKFLFSLAILTGKKCLVETAELVVLSGW